MSGFVRPLVVAAIALLAAHSVAVAQTAPATRLSSEHPPVPKTDPTLPTLWIVGDSTVKNGTKGQVGWGDPIIALFDTKRINVINYARGGRSSRTYQTEGLWGEVTKRMKAGDFVLMQFGHNDPAPLSGDNRERGTIRGTGDETEDVTLTLGANKGKQETVHSFGWYMTRYVTDAKEKGATPIVLSYIPRAPGIGKTIDVNAPLSTYALWSQQVAEKQQVPFFDLFTAIQKHYATMTPEEVKKQYYTEADNTHTSATGAQKNAEIVAEGIRGLSDVKLKDYLLDAKK